jgi:hypothetical protein
MPALPVREPPLLASRAVPSCRLVPTRPAPGRTRQESARSRCGAVRDCRGCQRLANCTCTPAGRLCRPDTAYRATRLLNTARYVASGPTSSSAAMRLSDTSDPTCAKRGILRAAARLDDAATGHSDSAICVPARPETVHFWRRRLVSNLKMLVKGTGERGTAGIPLLPARSVPVRELSPPRTPSARTYSGPRPSRTAPRTVYPQVSNFRLVTEGRSVKPLPLATSFEQGPSLFTKTGLITASTRALRAVYFVSTCSAGVVVQRCTDL